MWVPETREKKQDKAEESSCLWLKEKETRFELHILCLPDVATKYPTSLNVVRLSSMLRNAYI